MAVELTGTGNFDYTNYSGWTRWDTRWKDIGVDWQPYKFYPSDESDPNYASAELAATPYGETGDFFTRIEHNADQFNFLAGLVNSVSYVRPVTFLDHYPEFSPYTSGHMLVPKDCWNFETEYHFHELNTITLTYESSVTWQNIMDGMIESGKNEYRNTEHGCGQACGLGVISEDDFVSYIKYNLAKDGSSATGRQWFIRYIEHSTGHQSSFIHSRYGSDYLGAHYHRSDYEGHPNWLHHNGYHRVGWNGCESCTKVGLLPKGLQSGSLWRDSADAMDIPIQTQDDLPSLAGGSFRSYLEKEGTDLEIYNAKYDYTINPTTDPISCDSALSHKTGLGLFGTSGNYELGNPSNAYLGHKTKHLLVTKIVDDIAEDVSRTGWMEAWPGFSRVQNLKFSTNWDWPFEETPDDRTDSTAYPDEPTKPIRFAETSQSFYAAKHTISLKPVDEWSSTSINPTSYIGASEDNHEYRHRYGTIGGFGYNKNYQGATIPTQVNWKWNDRYEEGNDDPHKLSLAWWIVNKEKCSNGGWESFGSMSACEDVENGAGGVDGRLWVDSPSLPFSTNYNYSLSSYANGANFLWGDFSAADAAFKSHGLYGYGSTYIGEAPTGATFIDQTTKRRMRYSTHISDTDLDGGNFMWGDSLLPCGKPGVKETITDRYCCPKYFSWSALDGNSYPVEECWVNGNYVGKLGGWKLGYEPYYNLMRDELWTLNTDSNVTKAKNFLINNPYQTYDQFSYLSFLNPGAHLMEDESNPYHWNSYITLPYKGTTNRMGFESNGVVDTKWLKSTDVKAVADRMGLPLDLARMVVPYKFKEFEFDYSLTSKSIIPSGDIMYYPQMNGYKDGVMQFSDFESTVGHYYGFMRVAPYDNVASAPDPKAEEFGAYMKTNRADYLSIADRHLDRDVASDNLGEQTEENPEGTRYYEIVKNNRHSCKEWQGYNATYGYNWISKAGYQAADFTAWDFDNQKPAAGGAPAGDDLLGMRKIGDDVASTPKEFTFTVQGYQPIIKKVGQFVIANQADETEWIRPIPIGHYNNTIATNDSFGDFNLYGVDFVKRNGQDMAEPKLETVSTWTGNRFHGFMGVSASTDAGFNQFDPFWPANATLEWLSEELGYKAKWYWGLNEFSDSPVLSIGADKEYKEHMASVILNTYPKRMYLEYMDSVNEGTGSAVLRHFQSDARYKKRDNVNVDAESISHIVGRRDETFGSLMGGSSLQYSEAVAYNTNHAASVPSNVVVNPIGNYTSGNFRARERQAMTFNPVPFVETEFLKREVQHHEGSADIHALNKGSNDGSISTTRDPETDAAIVFFDNTAKYTDAIGRVEYGFYFNNGFKIYGSGMDKNIEHKTQTWDYDIPVRRTLTGDAPLGIGEGDQDDWPPHGPFPDHGTWPTTP